MDEVTATVVGVVVALALVRLAVWRSDLLFKAIGVSRACERVDQVTPARLRSLPA